MKQATKLSLLSANITWHIWLMPDKILHIKRIKYYYRSTKLSNMLSAILILSTIVEILN